jgi:2-dehydro-3-deoxy-L-rhamnonate dehydrogenase (NAD+)
VAIDQTEPAAVHELAPASTLGTVLVTGGARGLGAAVAAAVVNGGGAPHVLDLQAPADDLAHEQVDLADPRAAEAAVMRAAHDHGGLDAIVTAAGIDACGDLADVDAALPFLERSRGRVVTVASTLGLRALPAASAYCASKHGVVGFTRALALEVAGRIGVTMIIPGGMRTGFFDDRPEQFRPAPKQQLNDPADVARTVLFALRQPPGCELRELIVTPSTEPSWP